MLVSQSENCTKANIKGSRFVLTLENVGSSEERSKTNKL